MQDPKVAKNPIVKKYNFILAQHKELQKRLSIRKDASQQRAFMAQGYYQKIHKIIIRMFESIDNIKNNDSDMWQEAIAICKTPLDYGDKPVKGAGFDLVKALDDLRGFYIAPTEKEYVEKAKKVSKKTSKKAAAKTTNKEVK